MSNINKIFMIIVIISLSLIQNYYVTANTLNSSQIEFKVSFSGEPQVSNANKVVAAITDDLSATINVTNLTMEENKETVTYIVQNTSKDLSANLSVEIANSNKKYFDISSKIEKTTLEKGEATKITITIELIKTPILESEKTTIGIKLKAIPVQPTGNISGEITNDNETKIDSPITNIKDYYEKDKTPKTGTSILMSILGG